jgi:hypothetical protein
MKAADINIDNKYKHILFRIDHYRSLISSINFETIFEPFQLLVLDNENVEVKITSLDDIISWQKELSYSFVTKIHNIENQILHLTNIEDIYSASILLRHHMEQCGYITLANEFFLEFLKDGSLEIIEKFIEKTSFGSPLSNNKNFKYTSDAFASTRTPKIIKFIEALDRFIEEYYEPHKKYLFSKNYSMLNHFAHPSSLSSTFFSDVKKLKNGHEIKFRYKQNALGDLVKYNLLKLLEQNILAGYSSYFIFNSFELKNNEIIKNEEMLKYCWINIIDYFNKGEDV